MTFVHPTDVTVAVLAGGQSSRMGREKSFVPLKGKPMIAHTLARVQQLNLPVIVITNQPDSFRQFKLPLYGDVQPLRGSLVGLHAALYHSRADYTLCVACDMPLLNVDLLSQLITLRQGHDAVVPMPAGRAEPLHALYHRRCLHVMERQLQNGEMHITRLYQHLNVRYMTEDEIRVFDPDLRSFTNANTPQELAAIEALL